MIRTSVGFQKAFTVFQYFSHFSYVSERKSVVPYDFPELLLSSLKLLEILYSLYSLHFLIISFLLAANISLIFPNWLGCSQHDTETAISSTSG